MHTQILDPTPADAAPITDVLLAAQRYYARQLAGPAGEPARAYLTRRRGLPSDATEKYSLGWADGQLHWHLVDQLGMDPEHCIAAGVLQRDETRALRDALTQRLVIPNTIAGEVAHLTGRTIGDRRPSYLHIPAPISRCYNEDACEQEGCIAVFDPLDAIALQEAGYPALAWYGPDAPRLVESLLSRRGEPQGPLYLFAGDTDAPEEDAPYPLAELLGPGAFLVNFDEDEEPSDLFRYRRREDIDETLDRAEQPICLQIQWLRPDLDPAELNRRLESLIPEIAACEEPAAEFYIGGIAEHLKLSETEVDDLTERISDLRAAAEESLAEDDDAILTARSPDRPSPYSALFDGLVEVCDSNGETVFLYHGTAGLSTAPQAEVDGALVIPPPSQRIPWLLPRAAEVLRWLDQDDDQALFDDLVAYHESVSELPGPSPYHLLAAWTMHTYLLDFCDYSPILYLWGGPERGKTRTGRGIAYVAYRGLPLESLREPCVTRIARDFRATLFLDVHDLARRLSREGTTEALLHRFEEGIVVPRVRSLARGPYEDMEYLPVFGATIIGTNEPPSDVLRSRSLVFALPDASRTFDTDVLPRSALPLKERLVAFRARHLAPAPQGAARGLPDVQSPYDGRFADISRPLLWTARLAGPEPEAHVREALDALHSARPHPRPQSVETIVLSALAALAPSVRDGLLPLKAVTAEVNRRQQANSVLSNANSALSVANGALSHGLAAVSNANGVRNAEGLRWHPKRIAQCLWRLGFARAPFAGHTTAIVWDQPHLARLCATHAIDLPLHPPDPDSPPADPG